MKIGFEGTNSPETPYARYLELNFEQNPEKLNIFKLKVTAWPGQNQSINSNKKTNKTTKKNPKKITNSQAPKILFNTNGTNAKAQKCNNKDGKARAESCSNKAGTKVNNKNIEVYNKGQTNTKLSNKRELCFNIKQNTTCGPDQISIVIKQVRQTNTTLFKYEFF
ncbi:unnamed protein product [Clavelina lepadiformis]|uniref:Uncharacterized protein n=1 Tax=Clavelina lepadiformis TaxID=159417 RepID=A0ABP0FHZ7_CLALP